jgi:ubiquinone/menaquinone biosynthesis C-methylase UbiE
MTSNEIHFDDGAAYDHYMGPWSQRVGDAFLRWCAPRSGWHWLDVGCGSGAFTEMIIDRCAPSAVVGIDPAPAQIAYARQRLASRGAEFHEGDAMALPFTANAFDAAVMPLVIFFVPVPAIGVAEMVRVVRAGGLVGAYAWDMHGGGFPYDSLNAAMRSMGIDVPVPPSPDASRLETLDQLWHDAGVEHVETRAITVTRTFENFEDYWQTVTRGPNVGPRLAAMSPDDTAALQARMREVLPVDAAGRITYGARAHAVKGHIGAL